MDDVKEEIKTMKKNNKYLETIESKVNDIINLLDTVENQVKRYNVKIDRIQEIAREIVQTTE